MLRRAARRVKPRAALRSVARTRASPHRGARCVARRAALRDIFHVIYMHQLHNISYIR